MNATSDRLQTQPASDAERSRARKRLNPRIARVVKREHRLPSSLSVDIDTGIGIVDANAYRDVDNQPGEEIVGKLAAVRLRLEISQIASARLESELGRQFQLDYPLSVHKGAEILSRARCPISRTGLPLSIVILSIAHAHIYTRRGIAPTLQLRKFHPDQGWGGGLRSPLAGQPADKHPGVADFEISRLPPPRARLERPRKRLGIPE
jgi:hypothetical protein